MNMFEHLVIISLITWGIHCLFNPEGGFIFSRLGDRVERLIGTTLCKPLFLCPPCMGSFWGLWGGYLLYGISFKVVIFMIALCGLNFILKSFIYPEYED